MSNETAPDPAAVEALNAQEDALARAIRDAGISGRKSGIGPFDLARARAALAAIARGEIPGVILAADRHVVHVTAEPVAEDAVWCEECEEWVTAGAPEGALAADREPDGLREAVWPLIEYLNAVEAFYGDDPYDSGGDVIEPPTAPGHALVALQRDVESVIATRVTEALAPVLALADRWEREAADPGGHSLLKQTYRALARDLRTVTEGEAGRTETSGEVGTGAGEGAPRQDTGSAWVTRSADCPEAPAQAHLPAPSLDDQWDYDAHPGDCCPRRESDLWTVCCRECAGTGAFPVPWAETPAEALSTNGSCVACKATGRAAIGCAAPVPSLDDPDGSLREAVAEAVLTAYVESEAGHWLANVDDAPPRFRAHAEVYADAALAAVRVHLGGGRG